MKVYVSDAYGIYGVNKEGEQKIGFSFDTFIDGKDFVQECIIQGKVVVLEPERDVGE